MEIPFAGQSAGADSQQGAGLIPAFVHRVKGVIQHDPDTHDPVVVIGQVEPKSYAAHCGGTGTNEEPALFQSRHPAHDGKDGGVDQCRAGITGHNKNESAEPAKMKHQLGDGAELA